MHKGIYYVGTEGIYMYIWGYIWGINVEYGSKYIMYMVIYGYFWGVNMGISEY